MSFPPASPTSSFPYQIEARVGEGAMGVVYRAVEPSLERPVAIKTLRPQALAGEEPETAREYRLRFLQEARAAAALSHPGAATIYRIGEEEGTPYIAMEWLEGRTLEQLLRDEGRLPPERAVALVIDLLGTLDAAHRRGVVHRDIKPANLVLLPDGRLKVTDFGIARIQGSDLVKTQAGFVLATPRFASPEQLRGEDVDGRSDLFAAGILLFHLLTGRYPFAGGDFFQMASSVFRDEPTPLRAVDPSLPASLSAAVDKALAKDREDRFSTAPEMARALAETLHGLGETRITAVPTMSGPAPYPSVLRDLPHEAFRTAVAAVRSWPSRELGLQATRGLLDRLLDRPLHAPAFAGAALLDDACLFMAEGLVLAAVDTRSGEAGDGVLEALPATAKAVLHPVPEALGAGCVRGLASLLHPPRLRHEGLDSSFVNLPALAGKLREEAFGGALRLRRGAALGTVLFDGGRPVLSLFSSGWDGVPVERPWEEWVSGVALRADVEERREQLCFLSFQRELRDVGLDVPLGRAEGLLAADPMVRFLRWCLEEVPPYFRERDRASRWKYLVDWLADVRRAALHHPLPRIGTETADDFDLATFDESGRALHLARRVVRGTPEALTRFRDDVVRAKTARLKTGDVGGAFLIARHFDDATIAAWRSGERGASTSGGWSFGVEETFTGYEGFVRVGPRRGFHLLLVQETGDGFVPIL